MDVVKGCGLSLSTGTGAVVRVAGAFKAIIVGWVVVVKLIREDAYPVTRLYHSM